MPVTVLLIEDDACTARLLAGALSGASEAFTVREAGTLAEGLDLLEREPIACALVDYRLPDGDGLTALRTIRRAHPEVPVIIVTGAGSQEVAVEAMKLGADDYIVKH